MDPISITASIIGIVAAAASTARAFEDLRRLCKTLPGRLHALSNEVSDIELVLHQVASVVQKRASDPTLGEQERHMKHLLDQAASKLRELRTLVQAFTDIAKTTKVPFFQTYAWRKNQPRLQVLQEDSPRDVSTTRGYSVLRWAMYGKRYQTCKFLFNAGADPDYRPIAASDNSPRNKAHQFLLMGGLSNNDVEALRCLTRDEDFIDEQNYTILHRIILGLSMADLEEEIRLYPENVNTTDVMGRTPLAWAACRGDDRAIITLLSHGAEVNTLDVQHSGVVGSRPSRR